jgi:inner membrane protein
MDTLTHALSGALLARATESKLPNADQLPRRARMWVGFWAAAFPDSDFIVRFIDPLVFLTSHRGITHSVVMLPLWAAVLAWLLVWFFRGRYSWRAFVGVVALGIGVHIAGDVITAFGTMIFAPLSTWRAQIPTTFIIDPYFTAIIVSGLLASAYWKNLRRPAVIGLGVLTAYIGFQGLMQQRAVAIGERYIAQLGLPQAETSAIPQPFSPFHWMIVVSQPDGYHLSYVSLVRSTPAATPPPDALWFSRIAASYRPADAAVWVRISRYGNQPMEAALAEQVWRSETFARYRRFALFPAVYRVDRKRERTCVWFNDLRFALAGRNMPFRYGACRGGDGAPWRIYRLLNDGNGNEILDVIRTEG